MKSMILVGITLMILGMIALINEGYTYSNREKMMDIGPVKVTTMRTRTIPMSPLLGVIFLASGIALVVSGSKSQKI